MRKSAYQASARDAVYGLFVTTTAGEFVLRGAPHWAKGVGSTQFRQDGRWQFMKARFFVPELHEHTKAPAPWPMMRDDTSEIFG